LEVIGCILLVGLIMESLVSVVRAAGRISTFEIPIDRSTGGLCTRTNHIQEVKVRAALSSFLASILLMSSVISSNAEEVRSAVAKPVIHYFNVAPSGILANESQVVILTMSVTSATSIVVTFSPCSSDCQIGNGEAKATFLLSPSVTTTYKLTAKNSGGTVVASQKVEVGAYDNNPPPVPAGLQVTWGAACWYQYEGIEYQAMPFTAKIPIPPGDLPIEATLYYGSTTCDGEYGTDNLNDTEGAVPSGSWIFFFLNHPGVTGSSAIWTLGNQSSGCVSYEEAPVCS
jgi:hypothetical protein